MAVAEPIFLVPIRFASDNPTIRFHPNNAGGGTLQTVTLAVRAGVDYYLSGTDDPRENQLDLCRILENCLNSNTNNATERYTVSLSSRNVITITIVGGAGAFIIYWDDPLTTVDPTIFGWTRAATASSSTQLAPYQTKGAWIPGTSSRGVGKRYDSLVEPITVGATTVTENGYSRGYDLSPSLGERQIGFHLVDRAMVLNALAPAAEPYAALEYNWKSLLMCGGRQVIMFEDRTSRTQANGALLKHKGRARPWKEMGTQYLKRYTVDFDFVQGSPYTWLNEYAGSFNGTTSYVSIADHYRFDGLTAFTFAGWVYSNTMSGDRALITKWTTPAVNSFRLIMTGDEVRVYLASSSADTGANRGTTSAANMSTVAWHHIVIRYDGTGATNADKLRIWIDGVEMVLVFVGTIPTSLPSVATNVEIGRTGAVGAYATDLYGHFALYSTAMDAADIVSLYNGGVKADPYTLPNWSNIIGYWPMNGHVRDLSGNSHHGTAFGLAYSSAV